MSKTKIVEKIVRFELFLTVIGQNYLKVTNRKTFQNKIFQNWILRNTHVVTNGLIFKKLRNCAKLAFRKSGIGQFCAKWLANDCANCCFFFAKTDAQRKKNFAFRSAKIHKFCEWKPYPPPPLPVAGPSWKLSIYTVWLIILFTLVVSNLSKVFLAGTCHPPSSW